MRRFFKALSIFLLVGSAAFGAPVKGIKVEGLKWTKKEFVLRELLLKPGDEFSEEKLKESVRNLLNTHLFYRVEPEIIRKKEGVFIVLKVKEKFPIVPLPKFRLKSDGSYRAGLEVRDYNLLGMGHRLYAGYVKWYKTENESYSYYTYFNLYRIIENRINLYGGVSYSSDREDFIVNGRKKGEYRVKRRELLLGTHLYLDREKINQVSLGVRPVFTDYSSILKDKQIYYGELSYTRDFSTDMVYYQVGSRLTVSVSQSVPDLSDLTTGNLSVSYTNSVKFGNQRTRIYAAGFGTKLGYSGGGYQLTAPIPGYSSERITGKRYIFGSVSLREPVVDRSVYVKPTVVVGDAFRWWKPDDLLIAPGVELTAFWARLADGIIRFKLFRGIGEGADTQSSLKLTFRW